ncbi:MAG: glycoside hydrolase family 16 protein [Oscillospiraceae bacterium]|nr:glycoside hydrolase family 16 protein [Oscillospiraceae bacterium]
MKKYIILFLIFIAVLLYSCGENNNILSPHESIDNTASINLTENMKGENTMQSTTNKSDKSNEKTTITSPVIYTINAPVAGNYPQGLFKYPNTQNTNSREMFTQTLEWIPKTEKTFEKNTQYTAVLTLTPVSDKNTFDGLQFDDVKNLPVNNIESISSEILNDNMIIKIIFEKTALENAEPELLFYDDFVGDKLDYTKWDKCPNWDRQGRSTWDEDLVSVSDGCLHLGFVRDTELGELKSSDNKISKNWIRAGAIRSMLQNNIDIIFENTFGYYEAKIKFPVVRGMWGAFWLMSPTQGILADAGIIGTEIDIVESIFNEKSSYNAAVHWDGYGSEHKGTGSDNTVPGIIDIYDGEFHIFAFDWSPNEYIFYVDGVEFWRCDGGSKYNNCGINQNPNYIKLTVEGADWAGLLPVDFTEGEMLVDYVKVYNQPK